LIKISAPRMTFVKADKREFKDHSDHALITLIVQEGNRDLLEVIYDRYVNVVFHKVVTLINDRELAKDITHDILVKVMLNLSKFQMKAPFSLWVHSITYNFCMDFLRKKKRNKVDSAEATYFDTVESDDEEIELKLLKEIQISQLEALMLELTEEERLVMMMRYQDGFPIIKIAELLELNEGAVKMRLKRCRAKLINLLKNNQYED
jgi:RNA polymerase sigma factor (sigma-70 family)